MTHRASADDLAFAADFAVAAVPAEQFNHRAHLRLAYVYLCAEPIDAAAERMKAALLAYLDHLQIDPGKFHQTMTRAWVLAVRHFMDRSPPCADFDAFIAASPELLDTQIMLSHYSAQTLFSDRARSEFVAPDKQSIPPP